MAPVDRETFRTLMRPLCAMYGRTFDLADWTVYYQALSDISPRLLEAAVVLASRSAETFMPRPGELRAYAEQARVAALAAAPWQPCADCAETPRGFVETTDDQGVKRFTRCPCRAEHIARLEATGLPPRSLLDAPAAEHDDAAAWLAIPASRPDPRQLPGEVASAVKTIAQRHRMPSALPPQTDLEGRPLPPRGTTR